MNTIKILNAIFVLTLFTNPIYSQKSLKVTLEWGTAYKNEKDEAIDKIIYDDGQNIYATVVKATSSYFKSSVTPSLVKFDNKMTPIKRQDYSTAEKDVWYHGFYYLGGKLILITSKINSKTKSREVFVQKFNSELEPEGKSEMIWKLVGDSKSDLNFDFGFSNDSTKFYLGFYPEQKKSENKSYAFKIFDKDINAIFEKKVLTKIPSEQDIIKRVELSNKSELFVLTKIYKDAKVREEVKVGSEKVPGYDLEITKYSPDGNEKKINLILKNKFIDNVTMKSDDKGNLEIFLGYEESYYDGINGYIFLKIDCTTGNPIFTTDYPLTASMAQRIDDMQDDKPKNKKPAIDRYFSVTDFHTVENGSTYAIVEKNFVVKDKYGTIYFSYGMIIFKFDSKGDVEWCNYLPKLQYYGVINNYLYHSTMYLKNDLIVFYNDEKDNEHFDFMNSKKSPKKFNDIKEVYLMMVQFDDKGKMERKTVANTKQIDTNIDFLLSKQLSPNRMVLCGLIFNHFGGNRKTKLGVANFE
jgi:hypothetical protein